ncbi:hypothetical protein AB0C76_23780 [Kitasatospora sp. NPDC048722]|uniref:hypothetical protein n=1 Tax=Kitasatospora sp. NPDC048722 TaxID=3155639 RepID=UPI0033F50A4C
MEAGSVSNVHNTAEISGHVGQLVQGSHVYVLPDALEPDRIRLDSAVTRLRELIRSQVADEAATRGVFEAELAVEWERADGPAQSGGTGPIRPHDPLHTPAETPAGAERAAAATGEPPESHRAGQVAELFLRLPQRRLVLLGDPGAGKTTLVLLLTLHLLSRTAREPLPVPATPDTWDPRRERLRDWFVHRLEQRYPEIERRYGAGTMRILVDSRRVFPIFDGLDELPSAARIRMLVALTQGLEPRDAVIITSRVPEYQEAVLSARWIPDLVLRARPIEPQAALHHLDTASHAPGRWSPVAERLRQEPSGPLARILSSPLNIWLAHRVHGGPAGHPAQLADRTRLPDEAALQHHLLDALVPALFGEPPASSSAMRRRWHPEQADAYLRFLARRFTRLGSRELDWRHAAPGWAVAAGAALLLLLAPALGSVVGPGLSAVGDGPPGDPLWLTRWAGVAAVWALMAPVILFPLDYVLASLFATADDRWRRPYALAAVVAVAAGFLAVAGARHDTATTGVTAFWGLLVAGFRVLRVAIHPARAGTARAQLERERYYSLACAAWISAVVAARYSVFRAGLDREALSYATEAVVGFPATVLLMTPWGRWQCGRFMLALVRQLPWRTSGFLQDARTLGALRMVDGAPQFRHSSLQQRLAGHAQPPWAGHTDAADLRPSAPGSVGWQRGLPWQWPLKRSVLMWVIIVAKAALLLLLADVLPAFPARIVLTLAAASAVQAFYVMLWQAVRLCLRCRRLGYDVRVSISPELLDATVDGRRILLTPEQIARITVRPIKNSLGRTTRFAAVAALVHDHEALPPRSRIGHDGWVVLVPLDRLHPLTPELSAVLAAFGGPRWEPPLMEA